MFEYLVDGRVADVIDQFQRAKPRERVGRFHDDAQKRKRVLDVRRLREPDPAELAKWNALLAELDFEVERVRTRTKEHGDFTQRHSLIAQVRDALRDKARLLVLVVRAHHYG